MSLRLPLYKTELTRQNEHTLCVFTSGTVMVSPTTFPLWLCIQTQSQYHSGNIHICGNSIAKEMQQSLPLMFNNRSEIFSVWLSFSGSPAAKMSLDFQDTLILQWPKTDNHYIHFTYFHLCQHLRANWTQIIWNAYCQDKQLLNNAKGKLTDLTCWLNIRDKRSAERKGSKVLYLSNRAISEFVCQAKMITD